MLDSADISNREVVKTSKQRHCGEYMVEEHTWLRQTSWDKKDEYYTPAILVDCIIPHLHQKQFRQYGVLLTLRTASCYSIERRRIYRIAATFGMGKTSLLFSKGGL